MNVTLTRRTAIAACSAYLLAATAAAQPSRNAMMHLSSPSRRLTVAINNAATGTTWSAIFDGKPVLDPARLSLVTVEEGDLLDGARLTGHQDTAVQERVRVLFGRNEFADNAYHESTLNFLSKSQKRFQVVVRCYDDAVAIRYAIGRQSGWNRVTIADENTGFRPSGNPTSYVQYLENYRTPHEHHVSTEAMDAVKPDTLVDLPAVFEQNGVTVAITEASLRRYAGMALMRDGDGFVSKLTPREDGNKVVTDLPMKTPWRVALVTDRLGSLLESNTIYCLNDVNAIGDTSWIKPGKLTFSWWNGDIVDPATPMKILSLEAQKRYIDFTHDAGLTFHSVICDESVTPWYVQNTPGIVPSASTDATKVRPDLDLAAIRDYAKSKNVRLWTWVHQGALRGRVEEAFAAFEKIGWEGMMVDFFDHDDQESVEFSEEILKAAARHHILIHLHGVWKPTGLQRTYPNLMNHEGALNLEFLKWSDECPPEHTLKLVFTRLIAGPMDYHLGGFRAVKRADFKPINLGPNVLGTRTAMLAMYVCFDNPSPMVADYPAAYRGQPGFEFIQCVPTWWDETRVLKTDFGRLLVTARRKGKTWYIGGLSAGSPQSVSLPLSWLGQGSYKAEIWCDSAQTEQDPNAVDRRAIDVKASDTLTIPMGTDGGFVIRLTP